MDADKRGIEPQHALRDDGIPMRNCSLLLLVLCFLLFAGNGWGATYYVDQRGGNDANSGTSTGNAWKTVAKVNSSSFSPGDYILFKRGEVWRDAALVVPSSGSAGNPITFGAYGTGANPVINGANIFTTWTQEDQGGWYAYWATSTVDPRIVMQNDTRLPKSATKAGMTPGTHWWDSGNNRVYVRTTGSDNPSGYIMQVAQRPSRAGLIQINYKSHIVIDGIDVIYSRDACVHNYPFGPGQTNITVKNLTTSYSYGGQITLLSDTQWVYNVTIDHVTVSEANIGNPAGSEAITVQRANGFEVKNSTIHDFYQEGIDIKTGATNGKIYNNHLYNQKPDASYSCPAIYLSDAPSNIEVYNNRIHGMRNNNPAIQSFGIYLYDETGLINSNNVVIHHNIIYDSDGGINFAAKGGAVGNFGIYNNVITGTDHFAIVFGQTLQGLITGTNYVRNNIFWENGYDILDTTPGAYVLANTTVSHNLFKIGANTNTLGLNYVQTSDVKFADYAGSDFRLQSGSPAIDAGTYVGLTSDFLGNLIPSGAAPDIGAYEYTILPTAPANLSATPASPSQITLSWTDQSTNETGFLIERKTGAGGTYAQIGTAAANATTYGNSGLAEGTTYFYRVRAVNGAGNSAYSNEASATTPVPISLPTAPGNLSATPASPSQITLSWTDQSTNETGFLIERKTGAGGTYAQVGTAAANATTYGNSGLAEGTVYFYRVRAVNDAGNSAYSNEASATTPVSLSLPTAPANLSATPASPSQVTLRWTDQSTNETGFLIEQKTGAGGTYAQVGTAAVNATTYGNSGLAQGTTYFYRVRAVNGAGNSAYSNEASATTPVYLPMTPNPPSGIRIE